MLEPNTTLFHRIIEEVLGENSLFASRAVNGVKIVEKDHPYCQTLCIGKSGNIIVNKHFWTRNVKNLTDAKILMVHEMLHSLLGDTGKLEGLSKSEMNLRNFSMDMRINAAISNYLVPSYSTNVLHRSNPGKGYQGLLRPNATFKNSKFDLMYQTLYPGSVSIYRQRYLDNLATPIFQSEEALAHALKHMLPKGFDSQQKKITLLGSHKTPGKDDDFEEVDGVTADDLASLPEDIKDLLLDELDKKLEEAGVNAGKGSLLMGHMKKLIKNAKSMSLDLLGKFACSAKINSMRCLFRVEKRTSSVIPIRPAAKDMSLLACGYVPVLWNNKVNKEGNVNKNVAIYLDVSGSVDEHLKEILGTIGSLRRNIKTIFCFSTKVSEHSMTELSNGRYSTTGGTDFTCIADHAIEKGIDKCIIFTDGYASLDSEKVKKTKEQIKDAAVVYFGQYTEDNFWHKTYGKSYKLQELLVTN
jgi:hypothetical protein